MIKNLAIKGGGSNKMLLIAALVLGLLAAILVGVYLSSLNSEDSTSSTTSAATVPVVVAIANIPASTVITQEMVTVKSISTDAVVQGVFSKTADVVGQTTQVPLLAGEQVLPAKVSSSTTALSQFGINTPASLVVPQGLRAITVVISPVAAAAGMVRPGDHVDLIHTNAATNSDSSNGQPVIASACFILQDVQVMSIDTTLASADASTNAGSLAAGPASGASKLMVVAVSPKDASLLAAAQQTPGDASVSDPLWVALRPFGEHGAVQGLPQCVQGAAPAAPAS